MSMGPILINGLNISLSNQESHQNISYAEFKSIGSIVTQSNQKSNSHIVDKAYHYQLVEY